MADATTPTSQKRVNDPSKIGVQIADAVTLYKDRLHGIRGEDHATTQGYADAYAAELGMMFAGRLLDGDGLASKLGDTSATPPPEASLNVLPEILKSVTVTGVASQGDLLKAVYATDNQTMTLTKPSSPGAPPIGFVSRWYTSTTCDVCLLGLVGQWILGMAGGGESIMFLGALDFATLADGNVLTGIVMPFHGEIVEVYTITGTTLVGASGTALINLELAAVNVTGGVVTVATATQAAVGTKSAGTAITALNAFHQGDLLDVEVASAGATRTSGSVNLYIRVKHRPGV